MESPPFPRYLVPPRSKYPPQHHVLKHPQLPFLPQCQRPSFTPIPQLVVRIKKFRVFSSCFAYSLLLRHILSITPKLLPQLSVLIRHVSHNFHQYHKTPNYLNKSTDESCPKICRLFAPFLSLCTRMSYVPQEEEISELTTPYRH